MTPQTKGVEEAIKLAVEGGYEPFRTVKMDELVCELTGENYHCNFKPKNGATVRGLCSANINRILLDPLFWQALGKNLGWHPSGVIPSWTSEWHHFVDHLAEGKDPNSFFLELLDKR
jgi:hypothetical protein